MPAPSGRRRGRTRRSDARLTVLGVIDPRRLAAVLADPRALHRNAENLLCTAMVELFLRDLAHKLAPVPRE
ncbi:hypothetical protein [Streptomyces sp. NPDC003379]